MCKINQSLGHRGRFEMISQTKLDSFMNTFVPGLSLSATSPGLNLVSFTLRYVTCIFE